MNSSIFLNGTVYILPHSSVNVYNNYTNIINHLLCQYSSNKIILLGEYNLPAIQWSLYGSETVFPFGKVESFALANFSYLNLKQFITIINRKNYILDLILCNTSDVEVS